MFLSLIIVSRNVSCCRLELFVLPSTKSVRHLITVPQHQTKIEARNLKVSSTSVDETEKGDSHSVTNFTPVNVSTVGPIRLHLTF